MTSENETTVAEAPAAEAAPAQGERPAGGERPQGDRPAGERRGGRSGGRWRFQPRRKVCQFSADKLAYIDYKDVDRLRKYISERGKLEARRKTGTRARYQRMLSVAVKRARFMALLPYTAEHIRVSGIGPIRR